MRQPLTGRTWPRGSLSAAVVALAACVACLAVLAAGPGAAPAVQRDTPATAPAAAARPASQPAYGLTGHYYAINAGQVWLDDDRLPVPSAGPYAVRVDPQISFGRGKGFDKPQRQLEWWPPRERSHMAVIWTGYVRLPKAGIYYFPTASANASAVYVNRSRVTLNGQLGGQMTSDAFSLAGEPIFEANMKRSAYVVPVSVDAPRDVPIEVRFATDNLGIHGFGIDLYWVTPDSERDASGKPVAELVPAEALYVDAPGPPDAWVTAPAVSGAHSTLSSDYLYLPQDGLTVATITIRLADQKGRGVAGRKVHLSVLSSYAPAVVEQPKEPTNKDGIATAKIRAAFATGDLTIFATDLTDMVDVGQVATLLAGPKEQNSFSPPATSPYYDSVGFTAQPMPPVVGKPVKIRFPLHNPKARPVELTAAFSAFEWNIGRRDLPDLGVVEGIVLQPGETRVVEGTWVPKDPSPHLCFTITLYGEYTGGDPLPGVKAAGRTIRDLADLRLTPHVAAFGLLNAEPEKTPTRAKRPSIGARTVNFGRVVAEPIYEFVKDLIVPEWSGEQLLNKDLGPQAVDGAFEFVKDQFVDRVRFEYDDPYAADAIKKMSKEEFIMKKDELAKKYPRKKL